VATTTPAKLATTATAAPSTTAATATVELLPVAVASLSAGLGSLAGLEVGAGDPELTELVL
jgi:hypothetical protein